MNNLRLLTGLLVATLSGCGVCAADNVGQVMSIEDLFVVAESNSTQLRPSLSTESEAERELSVARSGRLPDINANLSVSYIGDGFITRRDFSGYEKAPIPHFGEGIGVNITQPLYAGGAITAGIDMAELKLTASRYATELQRDNIRFQLAGYYLDLYKCTNLRTVVEGNLARARKVLDDMTARYEQGVAIQNDITRYELLISNLELQLVKLDNTIDILNTSLVVTAGLPAGTRIVPDESILDRSLSSDGEGWWQQEAVVNAPSIKLARSSVDISHKAEALTRSERLPKIGLQAGWTLEGPILVEVPPIDRNLSYWYVGVGVSYNVSSIFKTGKSMARSRAATRVAIDKLDAAVESVSLGVRADYIKYREAYEELKTQIKSVELADRNYNTISTRYMADMALITDMLDAANSRLDAEQRLVNARIDIIYYYYKLLFTTGKI